MEKNNKQFRTSIGGQALIEGILMRGPEKQAIVVRSPEGLVTKVEELTLIKDKYPILGWPIIRGAVTFLDSMVRGVKALMFSADYYPEDENVQPSKLDKWLEEHVPAEKLQSVLVWVSVILSLGLTLLLFMLLAMFGPLLNLLIWTVAESWYFPHSLPSRWGLKYWYQVFNPYSDVSSSLLTSVLIALLSVGVCLLISVPAGYALSRRKMPLRMLFMLLFLIPQAFPNLTVYMNVARLFYQWGLNGSIAGVVLVHSVHGLMYSVWICVAAFSAIDPLLARASRNLGAGPVYTFWHHKRCLPAFSL